MPRLAPVIRIFAGAISTRLRHHKLINIVKIEKQKYDIKNDLVNQEKYIHSRYVPPSPLGLYDFFGFNPRNIKAKIKMEKEKGNEERK